jgi:galactokinase/mevalonate kinase-like predicted kinase
VHSSEYALLLLSNHANRLSRRHPGPKTPNFSERHSFSGGDTLLKLTIPARINVLGNPSDANEGDFATISAAVDCCAGAIIEDADELIVQSLRRKDGQTTIETSRKYPRDVLPLPYDGQLDLAKGAINRLYRFSSEFREKLALRGIQISTWTDVPRQSGLGGSSLFVLLALAGLREYYDLDRHKHNDYILAEITQRVEAKELGITCGFADRYVPLFGGIAYLDYRGKLHHRPIGKEPYVTYERLDAWADDLPLVAISTGIVRDSGDVHSRMRPRYLQEHAEWRHDGNLPPMVRFMSNAWETAWRGKIALLERDWDAFGTLMNQNHYLVNKMMAYCGFSDGAGWANNLFINVALKNGALGAKLTGAGGGGSVFALVRPGEEENLMQVWKQTARQEGFDSAQIYRPRIARNGLTVEKEK